MSRLMSVAMTTDAVIERRKTVTRRKGWTFLKPGDTLTLCRKIQGRKPDEPLELLAEVEVVSAWREPLTLLWHYETFVAHYSETGPVLSVTRWKGWRAEEMCREGFPGMWPIDFVQRFFIDAQGMSLDDEVTRIEWKYVCGSGFCECGGCVL